MTVAVANPDAETVADEDVWEPDYSQLATTLTDPQAILSDYQAHAPECILPSGYLAHSCTQAAVVSSSDAGEMKATFVFVTRPKKNEPNRAGRMIQIVPGPNGQGINFENYRQNPVVLFNHGFDGFAFPLGLSEDKGGKLTVKATKQQASADVFFNQSCPYAEDIFRMVEAKILRASSIGFNAQRVISMRFDDNSQLPPGVENCLRYGCDVVDSEMLEWSIVGIGADAGALRQCLETGKIAGRSYRPVLNQFLRQHAEPRQAWAPGADFGQSIIQAVTQGFEQGFKAVNANLVASAQQATIPQVNNVATSPAIPVVQSAPLQVIVTQQEFQAKLQQGVAAVVSEVVRNATAPIVSAQNGLDQRLSQLTGKLP